MYELAGSWEMATCDACAWAWAEAVGDCGFAGDAGVRWT